MYIGVIWRICSDIRVKRVNWSMIELKTSFLNIVVTILFTARFEEF